jgi:ferredoxin
MARKVIKIDVEKCVGCGLCAGTCKQGAIGMVNGKAKLLREDYCDGLGVCLPVCPVGAIRFPDGEERAEPKKSAPVHAHTGGCPGSMARTLTKSAESVRAAASVAEESELRQWPVQIRLAPVRAPYFENASLLIAADCAAYARASFHAEFMRGKVTLIGCPKLDDVDYAEKLTDIIAQNNVKSVAVVRMEVPCCGGLEQAAVTALKNSGKFIPWQVVTLSVQGEVLPE